MYTLTWTSIRLEYDWLGGWEAGRLRALEAGRLELEAILILNVFLTISPKLFSYACVHFNNFLNTKILYCLFYGCCKLVEKAGNRSLMEYECEFSWLTTNVLLIRIDILCGVKLRWKTIIPQWMGLNRRTNYLLMVGESLKHRERKINIWMFRSLVYPSLFNSHPPASEK